MNLTELSLLLAGTAHSGMALLGWQLYRIKRKQSRHTDASKQHLSELKHALIRGSARAELLAKLIKELREQLSAQSERVQQIEQQDPRKLPISQAARLAGLGTDKQELARICGLSRSEAELLAKLHAGHSAHPDEPCTARM